MLRLDNHKQILIGGAYEQTPHINQQITAGYTNGHTFGAGQVAVNSRLTPPVGPVPTTTPIGNPLLAGYQPVKAIVNGRSSRMSIDGFDVTSEVTGTYYVTGFATWYHSANNATVGFTYSVEIDGNWYFSPRPVTHHTPNVEGVANMAGGGLIDLIPGRKTRIWVATNLTGVVTCPTMSILIYKFL